MTKNKDDAIATFRRYNADEKEYIKAQYNRNNHNESVKDIAMHLGRSISAIEAQVYNILNPQQKAMLSKRLSDIQPIKQNIIITLIIPVDNTELLSDTFAYLNIKKDTLKFSVS